MQQVRLDSKVKGQKVAAPLPLVENEAGLPLLIAHLWVQDM